MLDLILRYILIAVVLFSVAGRDVFASEVPQPAMVDINRSIDTTTNICADSAKLPVVTVSDFADKDKPLKSWRAVAGDSVKHGGIIAAKSLLFIAVFFVCLIALALSVLSFSGAWLLLAASLVCMLLVNTPGWGTFVVFLVISIAGEIVEAISTFSGVKKRGGSRWAGLAGFVGAIVGGIVGAAIIPVVGALVGLLGGTFGGVFAVEWYRLRHSGDASYIAWGAFYARITVLFVKLGSAFMMSGWLLWRLIYSMTE